MLVDKVSRNNDVVGPPSSYNDIHFSASLGWQHSESVRVLKSEKKSFREASFAMEGA
jgi:hypothetical protein